MNKSTKSFSQVIGEKAKHKIKANRSKQDVWFGLGMMGLVGWSVVVPTLIGTAIGIWYDDRHPSKHSWTLTLLIIGLTFGCINAWHWVQKENQEMGEDQDDHE